MSTNTKPYISHNPGELITAEDWNSVQLKVQDDIDQRVGTAIKGVTEVPKAGDASTLGGKTIDELTKEILDKAIAAIPANTGYRYLFKRLQLCTPKQVNHGLKNFPLVDIYQLDYFPVVCATGGTQADEHFEWVNMYLYHTSESRIRNPDTRTVPPLNPKSVDIEDPKDPRPFKIAFSDMLERFDVKYTDSSSLDDLVTEFWKAVFADPNDQFDPDQYCHSPWFEKCCGEQRTVKQLKENNSWNDIWVKMKPRKTVNYQDYSNFTPGVQPLPATVALPTTVKFGQSLCATSPAPSQIQVVHFDFNNLGLNLLDYPAYPSDFAKWAIENDHSDFLKEVKLMVLLKV